MRQFFILSSTKKEPHTTYQIFSHENGNEYHFLSLLWVSVIFIFTVLHSIRQKFKKIWPQNSGEKWRLLFSGYNFHKYVYNSFLWFYFTYVLLFSRETTEKLKIDHIYGGLINDLTSRRHDWMSNIAMGTIFVNGFAHKQVHSDHSTSYVPKKEIIKETQSSFSFCFKFAQMFLHRIWQKFKKYDHKIQEKSVDYYYWWI